MTQTHINAYKEELARAEEALADAQSRVDELKAYIKANDLDKKESEDKDSFKVEVRTSKKGK